MKKLIIIFNLCSLHITALAQHPITFFTKAEAAEIKSSIPKYDLLARSYDELKKETDQYIGKDIDVPFPKDPAGGYTHDRHKSNYMIMFNSGILYNTTGEEKYATIVKNMLFKYAKLNPTLKNHPQATSSSPGHIFWQALNDANWLVYTGMAYDLIYNSCTPAERKIIEDGAFKPEVDFITGDLKNWFNLIHNHGVWACAGVGIAGIASGNKDYVDMALYGTDKKGNSGFLAQMNGLFSPDGYYTEGPYYVRYAILPFYLFANALQHARPELKIFQYRNEILKKALYAGLQQTNINGAFFPLNDALKEKDYTSNELVSAIDIATNEYGRNDGLLMVAKKQDRVLIHKGGVTIASLLAQQKVSTSFPYTTVEYTDGAKGDEGGISLLRNGKGKNLSTLIFKYASHGLSHGHFDELNINFFDKGNEIFTDYGSARFIGVEQKYGGRYLPENKNYASQTIAHNTIVVDETSQFGGNEDEAEKHHSEKLFSDLTKLRVQAVAAKEDSAYKGVHMQRHLYMLLLPDDRKFIIDIFKATSADQHTYDLPFQYNGNLISTSFKYDAATKKQEQLGKKNGYQFLWKEAEAVVKDTTAQFTFLNDKTYYTVSSLIRGDANIYFTRTGANDPNFNLRREPAYIIRQKGNRQLFMNVLEVHGSYDPVGEFSAGSYSTVKNINLEIDTEDFLVAEVILSNGHKLVICQAHNDMSDQPHTFYGRAWAGPFEVKYDGTNLKYFSINK